MQNFYNHFFVVGFLAVFFTTGFFAGVDFFAARLLTTGFVDFLAIGFLTTGFFDEAFLARGFFAGFTVFLTIAFFTGFLTTFFAAAVVVFVFATFLTGFFGTTFLMTFLTLAAFSPIL